jgi:hypothetical protein
MTAPPARPLPALLQEISELTGLKAALALADEWGGRRLYIPSIERLHETHELVRVVGMAAARKIALQYGREQVAVPLARASLKRQIVTEIENNLTNAAIAKKLGTTERWVERVRSVAKSPSDPKQQNLFD